MWRFLANVTNPNDPKDKQNKAKDRKEEYKEYESKKLKYNQYRTSSAFPTGHGGPTATGIDWTVAISTGRGPAVQNNFVHCLIRDCQCQLESLANVTDPNDHKDKQNKAKDRKVRLDAGLRSRIILYTASVTRSATSQSLYHHNSFHSKP
jgi:hypothetical protein